MTRRRLVTALPIVAFALTFGVFIVDKNSAARATFKSARGLLVTAVIILTYVLIGFLLRRVKQWWVAPVVSTVVVLGLAAWIVRPYYVDETANRVLVSGPVTDGTAPSPTTTVAPAPEPTTTVPPEAAPPATAPTTAPTAPATTAAPARKPATTVPRAAAPTAPPTAPPISAAPAPQGPMRISTGELSGRGHDASGRASIIVANGKRVVRLESFDIEGTPDPRVYVVPRSNADSTNGGTDLGGLSGNRGQILDYAVPAGIDPGPGWTVLIWCRAFSVPIAVASQAAT